MAQPSPGYECSARPARRHPARPVSSHVLVGEHPRPTAETAEQGATIGRQGRWSQTPLRPPHTVGDRGEPKSGGAAPMREHGLGNIGGWLLLLTLGSAFHRSAAPCRFSGAGPGAIVQRNPWTERHWVDDLADGNQLSGLESTPWTSGHGLLSGRPQVRVLPGARESAGRGRFLRSTLLAAGPHAV